MEMDAKTMAELMQKSSLKAFAEARETKREAMRAECAATREARLWQVKYKKALAEVSAEPKPKPTEAKKVSGEPVTKRPPRKLLAHLPEEERARIFSERAKKAAATRAAKKATSVNDPLGLFDNEPCPPSPSSSITSELEELFPVLPSGMTLEMYEAL